MTSSGVTLHEVDMANRAALENLLQLYIHDMSALFGVDIGADGRYAYPKLATYWREPHTHFAYLIRQREALAGFALVTQGSPASDDPAVFDVAEFFVLRAHRRANVGLQAAQLLWRRHPGRWTVRVAASNGGAIEFWECAVQSANVRDVQRAEWRGRQQLFRLLTFDSAV